MVENPLGGLTIIPYKHGPYRQRGIICLLNSFDQWPDELGGREGRHGTSRKEISGTVDYEASKFTCQPHPLKGCLAALHDHTVTGK